MEWDENSIVFSVIWLMLQQLWDLNDKYLQGDKFKDNTEIKSHVYGKQQTWICTT